MTVIRESRVGGVSRSSDSKDGRRRPSNILSMKTYHVTTFGCQMNEHDSERMKGMLESLGYEEAR